jgi:hypothetical protein
MEFIYRKVNIHCEYSSPFTVKRVQIDEPSVIGELLVLKWGFFVYV